MLYPQEKLGRYQNITGRLPRNQRVATDEGDSLQRHLNNGNDFSLADNGSRYLPDWYKGETSIAEEFELPTGVGQTNPYLSDSPDADKINWENPSAQEIAMIQQDPNLQMNYLQHLMRGDAGKGYFGGAVSDRPYPYQQEGTADMEPWPVIGFAEKRLENYFRGGATIEDFMALDEKQIKELLASGPEVDPLGNLKYHPISDVQFEQIAGYFEDLQAGMGRLQGGDVGIDVLTSELEAGERSILGPYGQLQDISGFETLISGLGKEKGTLGGILKQKTDQRQQAYVPQEKSSRYQNIAGGRSADPTQDYLAGISRDYGTYGAGISDINKQIGTQGGATGLYGDIGQTYEDIYGKLYGTEEGSVYDIYGDYSDLVKGTLQGPGGDPWWG